MLLPARDLKELSYSNCAFFNLEIVQKLQNAKDKITSAFNCHSFELLITGGTIRTLYRKKFPLEFDFERESRDWDFLIISKSIDDTIENKAAAIHCLKSIFGDGKKDVDVFIVNKLTTYFENIDLASNCCYYDGKVCTYLNLGFGIDYININNPRLKYYLPGTSKWCSVMIYLQLRGLINHHPLRGDFGFKYRHELLNRDDFQNHYYFKTYIHKMNMLNEIYGTENRFPYFKFENTLYFSKLL